MVFFFCHIPYLRRLQVCLSHIRDPVAPSDVRLKILILTNEWNRRHSLKLINFAL